VLTARTDLIDYVEAAEAGRDAAYRCRGCGAAVVLKTGQIRIAHFAHKPDAACAFGAGMSLAHLTAQRRIAEALRSRGVNAELEAAAPSLAGDRRIDVLAWPTERPTARIAIEVQASALTPALIAARSRSYEAEAIAPLWIRLVDFGAFEAVQTLPFRGTVWIEGRRVAAWERWAHDQLGGRLWFLDQGTLLAWRGTFVPAHRHRPRSSACGPDGEERSRRADWRDRLQRADLELEGPFDLASLRLNRGRAPGADGASRLCAWFVPPGETAAAPGEPPVRVSFTSDGWSVRRELQVRVEDRWVPALIDGAPADWRTIRCVRRSIL
jgi:competence protein CoiA